MSFNPNRATPSGGASRKRRELNPHAGTRRSQVVSRNGPQVRFAEYTNRKDTAYGWLISIFSGETFEVEYQFMCARNSSGKLCHPSKDRCIRVQAGRLFVIVGEETATVNSQQSFTIKAGVEYTLATSGTEDAEMLVCQGAEYDRDLKHLSPPEAINGQPNMGPVRSDREVQKHRENSIAQQQAAQIAEERAQKRAGRTPMKGRAPLPGQQVEGVNPRPVGAGGFAEE